MSEFAEILEAFDGATVESGVLGDAVELSPSIDAEVDQIMDELFRDLPEFPEPGIEARAAAENTALEAEARSAVKEVKELKAVDTTKIDPWESEKKFGKWIGTEIGKGALFVVGMKAVETVFDAVVKKGAGVSAPKEATEALQQAKNSREAMNRVKTILDAWNKWLLHHYTKRKSFGLVTTQGVDIMIYQIFQAQITKVNDLRNGAVTKAATTATKSKSLSDMKLLIKQEQKLVKEIMSTTNWLQKHGKKLTKAGVKLYKKEETEAQKLLGSVGVDGDDTSGGAGEDPDEDPDEDTGEDIGEDTGENTDDGGDDDASK
jgi:hypothetical protein